MEFFRKRIFGYIFIFISLTVALWLGKVELSIVYAQTSGQVIFSDNFEGDLSAWQVTIDNTAGTAVISTEQKYSGSKSLKITNIGRSGATVATHTFSQPQQGIVSVWFYDTGSANAGFVISVDNQDSTRKVMLGVRTGSRANTYYYRTSTPLSDGLDTKITRSTGWHHFEIVVTPKGSYGKIDGINLSVLPNTATDLAVNVNLINFHKILLINTWNTNCTAYFDDLSLTAIPPLPAKSEIAKKFVETYLRSYENFNLQQAIPLYQRDLGSQDPMHFYLGLLNTANVFAFRYQAEGRTSDLNKTIAILNYIDGQYLKWKHHWLAVGNGFRNVSRLVWDQLDSSLRQSIETKAVEEAEYFKNSFSPYSSYVDDSSGEWNLSGARLLFQSAWFMPYRPEAAAWLERAKFLAFHSLTKNETYGGWTSRTIYDDYNFDNHAFHPHPLYALGVVGGLAGMTREYRLLTGLTSPQFNHNVIPVYHKIQQYIDFRNFRIKGNKITRSSGLPNWFIPSGQDDWGMDAYRFGFYDSMKEIYGESSFADPETGFSTTDLAQHATEFAYYIKDGSLWRSEVPNVQFTEMLLATGYIQGGVEILSRRPSYRWFKNSELIGEYLGYAYPLVGQACILYNYFNRNNTSPYTGSGDDRFMCWKGRYYYCGVEANQWQNQGVLTVTQGTVKGSWNCDGQKWSSTSLTPSPSPVFCKPGDVDCNGSVNMVDLGLVIDAYGTTPPSDAWADLNNDGKVNMIDIGIVIDNYGL